jgi:ABC-type polysaccharide/polyol phosphate transport system ATPase subunit
MSPEGTVRVDQVWKRFRVDRGRRLLRDHLGRGKALFTRKPADEDPWRWVLRDINFELEPGESVGIVGANGAGKSTLFKIIAGVMFPHTGRIETLGSVGALIEVMSGIHSELTGRENITIYANLLGLSRKQVEDKFDEIVAFAEIENAVDRQVKFYSSGMKVRLGFAIAAFLEPTILIVDEVLAVGDATFQQKCLDRIRQVIQNGTTLLLVSHDLATVGATTKRGIWLSDGIMRADGPVDEVLGAYRKDIEGYAAQNANVSGAVRIHDLRTDGPDGRMVEVNEECTVRFAIEADEEQFVRLFLGASQGTSTPIFVVAHGVHLKKGVEQFELRIPNLPLPAGNYYWWFGSFENETYKELTAWQPAGPLLVSGGLRLPRLPPAIVRLSPVYVMGTWSKVS